MEDTGTWSVRARDDGVSFDVVVVPRASRSRVIGLVTTARGPALKLTLAAAPVDGEANAELCRAIANWLDVSKRAVQITHGEHHKHKTVHVAGISPARVREKMSGA
jgi:uncharacterized protein (TIGR00251 family)